MRKNKYGGYNDLEGWGSGPGKPNYNEYRYRVYQTWFNMLKRVNEEETYKDIQIDKRWLLFSNFVNDIKELSGYNEWLIDRSYQLDKDIKIPNSKIYSPDTCMFVSRKENNDEMHDRHKEDLSQWGREMGLKKGKSVVGTSTKDGSTIEFSSTREAERNGFGSVSRCCRGKQKTCGGYTWKYK